MLDREAQSGLDRSCALEQWPPANHPRPALTNLPRFDIVGIVRPDGRMHCSEAPRIFLLSSRRLRRWRWNDVLVRQIRQLAAVVDIGHVGIWTSALDAEPVPAVREAVLEVEELGYGAVWVPESVRREVIANSAVLLAATTSMVVATGIANLWARDAIAMSNAQKTLTAAYPERFLLGIGVSHAPFVQANVAQTYGKPFSTMVNYLDRMDAAPYEAAPLPVDTVRVLGALGPKMVELSGRRASGAHTYFVPPEHTADSRARLGEEALLCPELAVILETDRLLARDIARKHMATYLKLPNYRNNLLRLGFTEDDLLLPGSERLVDALVARGDEEAVRARVREHLDAGASHVCIQVLADGNSGLPMSQWRRLAPALLDQGSALPRSESPPARSGGSSQ